MMYVNGVYRELSLAYKNTPMPNTSGTTEQLTKDFDITQYGEDLTEKAAKGKLQPVIGRDEEIDRIAQVRNTHTGDVLVQLFSCPFSSSSTTTYSWRWSARVFLLHLYLASSFNRCKQRQRRR